MARSVRKLADSDLHQGGDLDERHKRRKTEEVIAEKPVPGSAESRQVQLHS